MVNYWRGRVNTNPEKNEENIVKFSILFIRENWFFLGKKEKSVYFK